MLFEFVERLHDETKRAYLPAVQGFREVTGIPLPGIHPTVWTWKHHGCSSCVEDDWYSHTRGHLCRSEQTVWKQSEAHQWVHKLCQSTSAGGGKAAAAEVSLHSHADHCVHIKSVINIVHTGRGRESNRGPRSAFEVMSQLRGSGRCFET